MRTTAVVLFTLLLARPAMGGGMGRPNNFGPLELGLGGAGFAGVADPSTIFYNPGGMPLSKETSILTSMDMVWAPRSYVPLSGPAQDSLSSPIPAPAFGFTTSFAGRGGRRALPFTLGVALLSPFGGVVEWSKDDGVEHPGLLKTSLIHLEAVTAVAYQVTSALSIGVGVRVGFTLVDIVTDDPASANRSPAKLSGSGAGVGAILGASYQVTPMLRVGLVYGSHLSVPTKGSAEVFNNVKWEPTNFELDLDWPQWVAAGIALDLNPVGLYAGLRWTDWSAMSDFTVHVADMLRRDLSTMDDGVSAHLGATWQVLSWLQLRAGVSFDSNTVPDQDVGRQFFDVTKFTVGAAASVRLARSWFLDGGYEALIGIPRDVPDGNPSPGRYSWVIHSPTGGLRFVY